MAYRPRYESTYGFETLDTLHNFFPELLYDEELFPNDMLRFMRVRMNTLFTPTFAREMHSYQIYSATDRRAAANQWMNLRRPAAPPPQLMRETHVVDGVSPSRAPEPVTLPARGPTVAFPPTIITSAVAAPTAPVTSPARGPTVAFPPPIIPSAVAAPTAPVTPIIPYAVAAPTAPVTPPARDSTVAFPPPIIPYAVAAPTAPVTSLPSTRITAATYAQAARRVVEQDMLMTPISIRSTRAVTPDAPRRGVTAHTRILGAAGALQINPMEELINSIINPTNSFNNTNIYTNNTIPNISLFDILGGAALNFTDVPVLPTNDEVDIGSEIVEHLDVPVETKCSVCQDHEPAAPTTWRKLHCSHYFHKTCIDPWFERDVHCPICRADIREADDEEEYAPSPPRAAAARSSEN